MDKPISKDILQNELYSGQPSSIELLYHRYGAMLFSYILQFGPDREEAANLLVTIFYRLSPRLREAFDPGRSIYCWLQVEARKIILEHGRNRQGGGGAYYFSLLEDASSEHQWVFRELFLNGRNKEELALRSGKDLATVGRLLRESLLIIRKKLA